MSSYAGLNYIITGNLLMFTSSVDRTRIWIRVHKLSLTFLILVSDFGSNEMLRKLGS
jgi:hypothetical protein